MRPPIKRMTKTQIEWLNDNYCKHGHTYLHDYSCLALESPPDSPFHERIGFLDLECTGLKSNWDFILSYCIKELDGPILGRHVTKREISGYAFDKNLTVELIADVRKFDRIITYYGQTVRHPVYENPRRKVGA